MSFKNLRSPCSLNLFGIRLTRGASAQIVLRAGDRMEPAYQEVRKEIKVHLV